MTSLDISLFDKAKHDRTGFSCGIGSIDSWFKQSISQQIKNDRVRVWCGINEDGVLVGFYALSAYTIDLPSAGHLVRRGDLHDLPAIYLNAIAVDKTQQGQGVGNDLLMHVIRKCIKVSGDIGVAAIVLDVRNDDDFDKRARFYNRYGFKILEEGEYRMALSVKDAKAANIQTAL